MLKFEVEPNQEIVRFVNQIQLLSNQAHVLKRKGIKLELMSGFHSLLQVQGGRKKKKKRGVLPGLDRGASEDLSLQALKSDAVL